MNSASLYFGIVIINIIWLSLTIYCFLGREWFFDVIG